MIFSKNSTFYKKAKQMLDDFVANGGDVNELKKTDAIYKYIKDSKITDEFGNRLDTETRFSLLDHPRERKLTKNVREILIQEINEYLNNGGSFHINRKQLPFYGRLMTYVKSLQRSGNEMTVEQVMKYDLGFKEYSDTYYRCLGIEKLKNYRDEDGYVDSVKKDITYNTFLRDLAKSFEVPYYLVITLLANEKERKYFINLDKIEYTKRILQRYAQEHKTFVGIGKNNPEVYNALDYLTRYYSDGVQNVFSKQEWLDVFGLGDVENRFKKPQRKEDVDFEKLMSELKQKYRDEEIVCANLPTIEYRRIIKKAISMNVQVYELFRAYGLKIKENNIERLSSVQVDEIPYLEEMKKRRDEIIAEMKKPNMCKEELLEIKVQAMRLVFKEFQKKLESYMPYESKDEVTNEI